MTAWTLLHDRRLVLESMHTRSRLGFLYTGYRKSSYFWESVVMFRKAAMIFIAVFLRSLGTRVQAFAVFLLVLGFVAATLRRKPYLARQLNDLEVISLLSSGVTLYAGFFFLSSRPRESPDFDPSRDFTLDPPAQWFFFTVIILSNAAFFFLWAWGFSAQLRARCRVRWPRLYLCCCLCSRRHLLRE